jgi:4-hydroxybenzoate polyprenyltransferase
MIAFGRDLLTLARLRLLPFVLVMVLFGYGWAHWDRALDMRGNEALFGVLLAWAALHVGTMWLNASLDRDSGEVLFGKTATVPNSLPLFGYLALALSVVLGWSALGWVGLCCALLAVMYSHPLIAMKGHWMGGPVINLVGYGLLSPYAGWVVVRVPLNPRTVVVFVCVSVVVLGCYFAAQVFQEEEDRERGYETFVVLFGPQGAVRAARVCVNAGVLGGLVLASVGFLPRSCLLVIPLFWKLDRFFANWERQPCREGEQQAQRLSWQLLRLAVVCVVVSGGEYVLQSYQEVPVAGLGTASGHPPDRPLLSPREMARWELAHGIVK